MFLLCVCVYGTGFFVQTAVRSFAAKGGEEYNPWEEINSEKKTLAPKIELEGEYAAYANTAFMQANSAKALDAVEADLSVMASVLEDKNTRQFFEDPSVSIEEKQTALDAVADEGKFNEVTAAVLALINDDGAIGNVADVSEAFTQLMAAQRGEVRATVTSAEPLSAADAKAVTAALNARLEKGQSLVLDQAVDPSIMGGLLVEFGNEFADLSVRSSVEDINQALRE